MYYPTNVRDRAHKYEEEDFAKLRQDAATAQLYSNGEYEVWRVYGEQQ